MGHSTQAICNFAGKIIYDSRQEALSAALGFQHRKTSKSSRFHIKSSALDVYICRDSAGAEHWHMGHGR